MLVKTLTAFVSLLGLVLMIAAEIPSEYRIEAGEYQRLMKLRSLNMDFTQHFQNITLQDLDIPSTRLPSTEDLQCLADMSIWMQGIRSGSYWSLKMIDAWGSIPSGILYVNLLDLGNFEECVKISKEVTSGHSFQGKYCFAQLPIFKLAGLNSTALGSMKVKIGICFPSTCTAAHMNTFLNRVVQQTLGLSSSAPLVSPETCQTNERESLDGLATFTVVLLSIFGGLALLATLFDYFLCQDQKHLPALVRVFSIRATCRALFRTTQPKSNPNVIDCLHGIRCMSLFWVVFGHEYMFSMVLPNINQGSLFYWLETPFAQTILHAVFSVDTFFFLSGLLVIMVALRAMERSQGKLNVPLMYLHRYLRLTPLLAMAILVYMKLLPHLVSGPLSDQGFDSYSKCERSWFWTLLYVQNYATLNICLGHSWYLGVDMQMYIIAPIFLFALYKWGKKAAIAMVVLIILLTVWLFTIMMVKKYSTFPKNSQNQSDSMRVIYFATHLHATPWLVGAVFGYFLHANRGKSFQLSRLMVWAGWIIALGIMFTCQFVLLPYAEWSGASLSTLSDSLYYSLTRIAWPISLCWVVFACMQGYGGLANSFLSCPLWQPLSRLSYSVYVWHILIQEINARRYQSNTYFSDYEIMLSFWSDFGFTVLTAFLTYITIEAPLGGLESLLLPARKPSPKPAAISAEPKPVPETSEKASAFQLAPDLEAAPAPANAPALST